MRSGKAVKVLSDQDKLSYCTSVFSSHDIMSFIDNPTSASQILKHADRFVKRDVVFYKIEEITFEEESPRLDALENALSCMAVPGLNLIYLLLGDKQTGSVSFYFGFSRDNYALKQATDSVKELGGTYIKPALEGNFRGSSIKEVEGEEIERIHQTIAKHISCNCEVLSGVPGGVRDKEKQDFRGLDRLVDVMQGDEFGLMIIAKPIEGRRIHDLKEDIFNAYGILSAKAKQSVQLGYNSGTNKNESINESESEGKSETLTKGKNESRQKSHNEGHSSSSSGDNWSNTTGSTTGTSDSTARATTTNKTVGKTVGGGSQQGTSVTTSYEITDKSAEDWLKYFDDVLLPRLDYANGKGAFVVSTVLFGENPQVVHKLSNVARSIYAGEMANMVPLVPANPSKEFMECISSFSLPCEKSTPELAPCLPYVHAGLLGYSDEVKVANQTEDVLYCGNWMSVRELAIMAGLPQREVIGMRLKEEVEFGLNIPKKDNEAKKGNEEDRTFDLGTLVKGGNPCGKVSVRLDKEQLDRHIFVAGVTGSGKTTTCQTLLLSSGWPFLVIEPAKTEYRGLMHNACPNLLVFTLGDDTVAPFRLNPFELVPGESITSRVDMLMASITSAFDMEAAIPQLIEKAIYECYKDYGWSLDTNQNQYYKKYNPEDGDNYSGTPFEDGVFAFPTLSDVLKKTEEVVETEGFDTRLKKDYIGSINARLRGLTLGAKGFMLDCQRSVDFMTLLDKQVVLELEPIPSAAQKSLIIGFILTNLLQAIKKKFNDDKGKKVQHITLIEEAHRLLTKPEPGSNPSQRQAAETFADMLAEIRKYGESLVIADQIPGKLTPEVIKNTNTKIIHRLFAQDDKEAVGRTMGLEKEQADFLSNLAKGRAIVFNGDWPKAVQVQVKQVYDTSSAIGENEKQRIQKAAMEYYAMNYKRGVYAYSELFLKSPSYNQLMETSQFMHELAEEFSRIPYYNRPGVKNFVKKEEFQNLRQVLRLFGPEKVLKCLVNRFYVNGIKESLFQQYLSILKVLLDDKANFDDCKDARRIISIPFLFGIKTFLKK